MMRTTHPDPAVQANTDALFEYFDTATDKQDPAPLTELLSRPYDPAAYNDKGETLLIRAITERQLSATVAFVKAGADINQKSESAKYPTALFAAIVTWFARDIAHWLIDNGADITVRTDDTNSTTLMTAIAYGKDTIAARLIAEGIDIHTRNKQGANALYHAIENGVWDSARACIEAGADIEAEVFHGGWTPLGTCATENYTHGVPLLMAAGASVAALGVEDISPSTPTIENDALNKEILPRYRIWTQKLEAFRAGEYTPSTREDWNHLASVLPLEDPKHPPSVAARIRMLEEMRPDISLGGIRNKAMRTHMQGTGL